MPRVLLLHTGGTLGMRGTPLEPDEYAANLLEAVPELARIATLDSHIVCNLDSSDLRPSHWGDLARAIADGRARYHGFVIAHGTDTMAYTASALAFALQGLDRPVVLTGAQRPLAVVRTDARRNITDAVDMATRDIPEVSICFDGMLLRGCRATKSDNRHYRAFSSPGVEPLAQLGVDVEIARHVRRPQLTFKCRPDFDPRVSVLYVVPGFSPRLLYSLVDANRDPATSELRGIVLATFGLGTVPTAIEPLAPAVRAAVDAGIDVLVVTQCGGHVDLTRYQNSLPLQDAGAIAGGAMLLEAAVTKLMHALANVEDRAARRRYLETNLAGERY